MKRTVTLEIAGSKYRLVADADEDRLQKLAAMVNERVHELGSGSTRVASPAQLLALTALGLADDLLATQGKLARVRELTHETISKAITRIDRQIVVPGAVDAQAGAIDPQGESAPNAEPSGAPD